MTEIIGIHRPVGVLSKYCMYLHFFVKWFFVLQLTQSQTTSSISEEATERLNMQPDIPTTKNSVIHPRKHALDRYVVLLHWYLIFITVCGL